MDFKGIGGARGGEDLIFLEDQFARELTQAGAPPVVETMWVSPRTYCIRTVNQLFKVCKIT